MQRSKAYEEFINQSTCTGRQRLDGYNPNLLNLITTDERDGIEVDIVKIFVREKDYTLAIFLPQLKQIDGISILKKELVNYKIPSDGSVAIAFALFDATDDDKYLAIINKNYKSSSDLDKIGITAHYSYHIPNKKIFKILKEIYLNESDSTIRNTAVIGLLYNCNLITNPLDMNETYKAIDLRREFILEEREERAKMLEKLMIIGKFDGKDK